MKLADLDINELTPMMQQYVSIKRENPEPFLFFRLGDFYELFFEDALLASKELDITLTKRSVGANKQAPMCGVPYHVANQYISRLIQKGYKVAVCDQMEDPKKAKGLVKREVTKIITPGTFTDPDYLDKSKTNYLLSIYIKGPSISLSLCDYATGELSMTEEVFLSRQEKLAFLRRELSSIQASEILIFKDMEEREALVNFLKSQAPLTLLEEDFKDPAILEDLPHIRETLRPRKKADRAYPMEALLGLLNYLKATQKETLDHLKALKFYNSKSFLVISDNTKRNLELVSNLQENSEKDSLFALLNHTQTSMGARMLKSWILRPLVRLEDILYRQDLICDFHSELMTMDAIKDFLNGVYDFERLSVKMAQKSLNPLEIDRLRKSLAAIKDIKEVLEFSSQENLKRLGQALNPLEDLRDLLERAIIEDPPGKFQEERYIKEGFDEDLDGFFALSQGSVDWLIQLEQEEREKTGIKNLKVKYNKILGYFIEVTKSNLDAVPDYYIRKQTLVGSERYFTVDLKEKEASILNAKDMAFSKQAKILEDLRLEISRQLVPIQTLADQISQLDAIYSLAWVARKYNYSRPSFNEEGIIDIKQGRHPTVEARMTREPFVPNDIHLDQDKDLIYIITGPNMAGKSTFMRQVALITILAQIGSYVPADQVNLALVDQIFTRIGASDNLSRGQSTFMVEMMEVSQILEDASPHSLILLDEVGRGTSTYDGVSIAWALTEYLADHIKAKTLFATHYHELAKLSDLYPNISNLTILSENVDGEIRFLRKIVPGYSNHSFGIEVARLAGIQDQVLDRADDLLSKLEAQENIGPDLEKQVPSKDPEEGRRGLSFQEEKILGQIKDLDINDLRPLDALKILDRIQRELKESGD
ncbi:MAG: DNA mismatch repair protein MutS [Tissierellia bacterium]|nr:DNA mismatch repair protein MutS [Tissierellia bacterium]